MLKSLTVSGTICLAFAFGARADVPPRQPETPLPAECAGLIGAWQSSPETVRYGSVVSWLFVNSNGISRVAFSNIQSGTQFDFAAESSSAVACASADQKTWTVTVTRSDSAISTMVLTQVDGATLNEEKMQEWDGAGAPPPDFKPVPVTVTWKLVAK